MTTYNEKRYLSCSDCGSSDALTDYGNHTYCFACSKYTDTRRKKENHIDMTTIYTTIYAGWRGVSKDTTQFYGVQTYLNSNENAVLIKYPYGDTWRKVRKLDSKEFYSEGDSKDRLPLFGMNKFAAGSAKAITITEGELDAMSVYEMMGKYPVVSVASSSSARTDCEKAYDYLNSFDKIYICFDADKPGQEAATKVAGLFNVNKIYMVSLDPKLKDANAYLEGNQRAEFTKTWWAAKKHRPKNIIESFDDIGKALDGPSGKQIGTYPFSTLNSMSYGIRTGEVTLFTAPEKVGKTEIMRAIEYHLLKTTEHNIGIIHLEESEKRAIQGLISYEVQKPVHLPTSDLSKEEQLEVYKKLVKTEGRVYFYAHFGSDDPETILGMIRYMVTACDCRFIFLDHITMIVTGHETDDERRKLDYISTSLATMAKDLDFHLFMVSHVNDDGRTRGSRNIAKTAWLLVHLDRDNQAHDPIERNTTRLIVRGNRFGSQSGPAGELIFDPATFILREKTIDEVVDSEVPF